MCEIPVETLFVGLIIFIVFVGALIMAPSIKSEYEEQELRIKQTVGPIRWKKYEEWMEETGNHHVEFFQFEDRTKVE